MNRGPTEFKLRIYTVDPSLGSNHQTVPLSRVAISLPWNRSLLKPGPKDEYLEVIDVDPASGYFYEPVDLNSSECLVQDGLSPDESNPQFHQQMVYAVAKMTILSFARALGRRPLWHPRVLKEGSPEPFEVQEAKEEFVKHLRVYPHGLREKNAYYDREKVALLFGYFKGNPLDARRGLPGGTVFTCLSFDIICHETAHALLDGLHPLYSVPTNPDVLAFHEAFADLVALLQGFSFPELVENQIEATQGRLNTASLLTQLAVQFGQSDRCHGGLRDALGRFEKGEWIRAEPDPADIEKADGPYERGAILVAAVFDCFLKMYELRSAGLFSLIQVAHGHQEMPLHPELVTILAKVASDTALALLSLIIRSLDYCPPVDLTFGDFLRALITADIDVRPSDPEGFRIAMIESFRDRGLYPRGVRNLSEEELRWRPDEFSENQNLSGLLREINSQLKPIFQKACRWNLDSKRHLAFYHGLKLRNEATQKLNSLLARAFSRNRMSPYRRRNLRKAYHEFGLRP